MNLILSIGGFALGWQMGGLGPAVAMTAIVWMGCEAVDEQAPEVVNMARVEPSGTVSETTEEVVNMVVPETSPGLINVNTTDESVCQMEVMETPEKEGSVIEMLLEEGERILEAVEGPWVEERKDCGLFRNRKGKELKGGQRASRERKLRRLGVLWDPDMAVAF